MPRLPSAGPSQPCLSMNRGLKSQVPSRAEGMNGACFLGQRCSQRLLCTELSLFRPAPHPVPDRNNRREHTRPGHTCGPGVTTEGAPLQLEWAAKPRTSWEKDQGAGIWVCFFKLGKEHFIKSIHKRLSHSPTDWEARVVVAAPAGLASAHSQLIRSDWRKAALPVGWEHSWH